MLEKDDDTERKKGLNEKTRAMRNPTRRAPSGYTPSRYTLTGPVRRHQDSPLTDSTVIENVCVVSSSLRGLHNEVWNKSTEMCMYASHGVPQRRRICWTVVELAKESRSRNTYLTRLFRESDVGIINLIDLLYDLEHADDEE